MNQPKNVRLFLLNGTASGIVRAEIGQWPGRALVGPRAQLGELNVEPEANSTGVYVLCGPDPDHDDREAVYIGEADCVARRLLRHNKKHEFWTRACVLAAADDHLTKGHVRYLEARLLQLAEQAQRVRLMNETSPPLPNLPAGDRSDMELFVEQAAILLPLVGLRLLQPIHGSAAPSSGSSPTFAMTQVGVEARAREVGSDFVVLAGSTARADARPAWVTGRALRDRLIEKGLLVALPTGGYLRFTKDIPFSSPTAAASIVAATNMNGRLAWKLPDGTTYATWQESQVAATQQVPASSGPDEG